MSTSKSPQFGMKVVDADGVERWVPVTFDGVAPEVKPSPSGATSQKNPAACGCDAGGVRSPTSTSTKTSTETSTEALTAGNFTATVTGGAGNGADTTVNIYPSGAAARGRLVAGGALGEPLIAVAEPGADGAVTDNVASCGPACEGAGTPNALIFDKYRARPGGGYEVSGSTEYGLPKQLAGAYAKRERHCLPWVRISRDPESFRGCLAAARALGPIMDSKKVVELVGKYLLTQDQEVFVVIMLDTQLQVRGISEIARGARDRVDVPVPDALRVAIIDGASAVIVCHQHPSGVAHPSDSDKQLTKTLKASFEKIEIEFLDHVIVADGKKHYSFAKSGLL